MFRCCAFRLEPGAKPVAVLARFFLLTIIVLLAPLEPLRATAITSGKWYTFSFTAAGVQARGCFPADMDPAALDCIPSPAANIVFAEAPPWTITLAVPARLNVTDGFLHGDSFEVKNNGAVILTTPFVATDGTGCGDNPLVCMTDPLASHGTLILPAGMHSLTIFRMP